MTGDGFGGGTIVSKRSRGRKPDRCGDGDERALPPRPRERASSSIVAGCARARRITQVLIHTTAAHAAGPGVLIAIVGTSSDARRDDAIERPRQTGIGFGRARTRFGKMAATTPRWTFRETLCWPVAISKEQRPERKDIGARIDRLSLELLRSHIGDSADQRALERRRCCASRPGRAAGEPRSWISRCLAIPKSSSFSPPRVNITLDGLRSR